MKADLSQRRLQEVRKRSVRWSRFAGRYMYCVIKSESDVVGGLRFRISQLEVKSSL